MSSTATSSRDRQAVTTASRNWMVPMLVLMIGSFMAVLDSSIVNAAIPTMQKELGASSDDIEWVSTAYTLALGVIVPISNWLGDRIGASLAHRLSMIGFAAASALCGLAWNLDSEIFFRVLQAIPGGILPVMTLTILYQIVPKEKMGSAMGIYGLGVVVAPAIGPTLGGYIVEYLDWRLIFYINVPIGIIGAVLAYFLLPKLPTKPTHRFDILGFLTIGYGLAALLLATSKGQKWGWTSYPVLILVVSGLLSLALFAVIENEVDHPLLDLRALRHWPFVNSLLIISVLSVGLFATSFYLPQFLQNGQNLTPLNAGMLLLPQALAMALLMPVAGRIYDRFGPKWPALIGLAVAAWGTYLLTGINVDMTHQEVIVWTIVRGVGNGLAMMPIMTAGLNSLPPEMTGYGSALNNIAQRVSSSIGLAGMGALVSSTQAQLNADQGALIQSDSTLPAIEHIKEQGQTALYGYYEQVQLHSLAGAYGAVFLLAAAMTAACVVLALWLRKPAVPAPAAAPAPTQAPAAKAPAAKAPARNAGLPTPVPAADPAVPAEAVSERALEQVVELEPGSPDRRREYAHSE
jgi:EmrB/QacA subfamily drug resistance transporter